MAYSSSEIDRAIGYAAGKLEYSLKAKQREAVELFLNGRDTFVSLPTGYGKSLCYCLLPFAFDALRGAAGRSIVICISPLTALMLDQRNKYTLRGLATEFVGEAQDDPEVLRNVQEGKYQLMYVSPESIIGDTRWREMLHTQVYQENLVAFVVDEAHCVKKW